MARTRLGLYATTSEGQVKPKRWSCPTRPLRPAVKAMARKVGPLNRCEGWFQSKAASADVDEVVEHPLLEAFHTVNDDWDHDLLIRYVVACLDVCGWFFLLPEATGAGVGGRSVPDLIWPLLAQYVIPFRTSGGSLVENYRYFTQTYLPGELVRGRCVSLRDPYGLGYGPAQAAWAYVGLNDQFTSIQENLMTQGGRISGFLTDADPANPAGRSESERAEQRINATWTRGNSGRIPYLPGAFKFNPTAWPPRDLAELQISDNALLRIANCFGVPISLLKTEDVNRANADAGHLQHSKLAIDPRCHLIASALTKWTRRYGAEHNLPGWDRLFWAFDNPVTEDAEQNSRIFTTYIEKRVFTPNEVRTELGYEPYDGGDEILVAGTLKTVDQIVNPPEPPPQLAPFAGGKPPVPEENDEPDAEGKKRLPFGRAGGTSTKDMGDRGVPDAGGHGEENTYGLPQGERLRDELRRWFERQRRDVTGNLPEIGDPLPAAIPGVGDWTDDMARAMTPMLSVYWDESGKATRERLGLDPDEWKVTNPHLREKIHRAAFNFCESTNASTSKRLDHALDTLRGELARGMVDEGESLKELTTRVNRVFEGLSKKHAETIAVTEASRAVHAAQETAAVESGVVAGFQLRLSGDACELCRKIYDECRSVRVGQAFAVIGDHPDYSVIRHPPLHVRCQCALEELLLPEFGGPVDPKWGQTLEQPQKDLEGHEETPEPKKVGSRKPVPISGGIDVQVTGDLRASVEGALKAIDSVHNAAELPKIPLQQSNRNAANEAEFVRLLNPSFDKADPNSKSYVPGYIGIKGESTAPRLATAHEVGHYLDHFAIPGTDADTNRDWATDPLMKDWHRAVMETEAIKSLVKQHAAGGEFAADPYHQYLLWPEEIWARSYSQFIATRAKDFRLKNELEARRTLERLTKTPVRTQWEDDDFAPVADEIAKIFKGLGWLK